MSARIAIAYAGGLGPIAEAVATGAGTVDADVRLLHLGVGGPAGDDDSAFRSLLRWCDGMALGTPSALEHPAPVLVELIERSRSSWEDGTLSTRVVTVFTDHPEQPAPDPLIFPLYVALYHWGAVVVGPRDVDLELAGAGPGRSAADRAAAAAEYRGRRLAHLATTIATERSRRRRLEL